MAELLRLWQIWRKEWSFGIVSASEPTDALDLLRLDIFALVADELLDALFGLSRDRDVRLEASFDGCLL